MRQYLAIEDEYYELRVEWIFGVSDLVIRTNNYPVYNQQPPRLGVAYADSITQQICRYFSPVFKSASSCAFAKNESALQALYD
jgi:hypothetical protein